MHVIGTDTIEHQLPDTPTVGVEAQPMSSLDGGTCAVGLAEWLLCTHQEALHQAVTGDMMLKTKVWLNGEMRVEAL